MKKIILLLCLLGATTSFAKSTNGFIEIINGEPAEHHPMTASVVGLFTKYTPHNPGATGIWMPWCTGTVLGEKLILTAAHCVRGNQASDIKINFSSKWMTSEQQLNPATRIENLDQVFVTRQVKAFEVHPAYDGSGNHDLAVLVLEDAAPATAVPVHLLPKELLDVSQNQTTFEGQTKPVVLLGFGLYSEAPRTETEVLRATTVDAQFLKNLVVTDQTKGSGGCNGDSGGPAFLNLDGVYYQVGVTHGPHGDSSTCHETGEWVNPALDAEFLSDAIKKLNP